MIDNSTMDRRGDETINGRPQAITRELTSNIKTITDLWSLARIAKDINGDPIWESLYQFGCKPEPFKNLGYYFEYCDYKGLYIPQKKSKGVVRFALPKLVNIGINSREIIMEAVNIANSLVMESKFTVMGEDVWFIHESTISCNEDYFSIVEHILENLKSGAELFFKIS